MWRVTLAGVWAKKLRFVSTLVAIVLGVGFMAGTLVLTDTVSKTFEDLFASVYKGTDAVVRPVRLVDSTFGASPGRLAGSVLDDVRAVSGVEHAEGYVQGYAQLVKANGKAYGGTGAPTFGFMWSDDGRLNPFRILLGRAPRATGEIAIDRESYRSGHFAIGQRVKVLSQNPVASFTLTGVMTFGSADAPAGASVIAFTPADAAAVFRTGGEFDSVSVVAQPGVTQERLAAGLRATVGNDRTEVLTGTEITKTTQNEIKKRLKGFGFVLVGFSVVALVVGAFIIYNTFSILVAQRTRELALLRAMGASRRQVVGSVVAEAAVVGLVASGVGVGFGMLTALGLRAAFAAFGFSLPGAGLVLESRTVVVAFVVGMAVTLASAVLPARRASAVAPVAALRDADVDRSASSRRRGVGGALVLFAALALLGSGLTGHGTGAAARVGFSALATIVAVVVLGPVIARTLGRLLGAPIRRFRGVPGSLAQANAVRNPRRTASTSLALTIGVAIIGLILVFVASFKGLITKTVDGSFKADYIINAKSFTGFSTAVAGAAAAVPGVGAVSPVRFGQMKVNGSASFVAAFDTATVDRVLDFPTRQGRLTDVVAGTIAVGADAAASHHWHVGDAISVVFPKTGPGTLRLAATLDDQKVKALTQGGIYVISTTTYDGGFNDPVDSQVLVKAAPGANLDTVSSGLDRVVADYPTAEVQDKAGYKRSVGDQLNQFVALIIVLLALSVMIAMFGIANTLTLSIYERRREIGLLRAVGMSRAQTRSAIRWESVIMAVLGTLVGLAIGVGYGAAIMTALRSQGFTVLVVPVGSLATVTAVAALFGVVAALRPAAKAARLDILDAIATE
jgi:putative ABC transport system permease protein